MKKKRKDKQKRQQKRARRAQSKRTLTCTATGGQYRAGGPPSTARDRFWEQTDAPIFMHDEPMRETDIPVPAQLAWRELKSLENEVWEALYHWREKEADVVCFFDDQALELSEEELRVVDLGPASLAALEASNAVSPLFEKWCLQSKSLVEFLWDGPVAVKSTDEANAFLAKQEAAYLSQCGSRVVRDSPLGRAAHSDDAVEVALFQWDNVLLMMEEVIAARDMDETYVCSALALQAVSRIQECFHAWRATWRTEIMSLTGDNIVELGLAAQRRVPAWAALL